MNCILVKNKRLIALLSALFLLFPLYSVFADSDVDTPSNARELVNHWGKATEMNNYLEGLDPTDKSRVRVSAMDALLIAIEATKTIAGIEVADLVDYSPSICLDIVTNEMFPSIRSPYWHIAIIPPEGVSPTPFYVVISAEVLDTAIYRALSEQGEIIDLIAYDIKESTLDRY